MDGHKEPGGKFHPHQDKPGIHSSSVSNDPQVIHTGLSKSGKVLQVSHSNHDKIMEELKKERLQAQKMQDHSDPKLGSEDFEIHWHYEGYEAGIVTVKQMIEKNPDSQLLTRIRKEEDRAIEEKGKKMPIDDDGENAEYYDGYHSGLAHGASLIRKYG